MLDTQSIVERLLPYLRQELKDTGELTISSPVSLQGGNETRLFRFRLAGAPSALPNELVLRIYPESVSGQRAAWESVLHNCLYDMGLPVPRVYFTGADTQVLDAPFIIMEMMPGHNLLDEGSTDAAETLGTAQARLHEAEATTLTRSLQKHGIAPRQFYPQHRLARLEVRSHQYSWLEDLVQWLHDNYPPQPEYASICHNDFHPLNLLVADGKLTAILDWSNFALSYPIMDVAFTTVILKVIASPEFSDELVESRLATYRQAYSLIRPLDMAHFDYFRVFRATMALQEGADGQSVWRTPLAIERLRTIVKQVSGVDVEVPLAQG